MYPLNEGTVPEVYTIPLDVHAPLAVNRSVREYEQGHDSCTQNWSLGTEVGHNWLFSELRSRFSNGSASYYKEGGNDGTERNHDCRKTFR